MEMRKLSFYTWILHKFLSDQNLERIEEPLSASHPKRAKNSTAKMGVMQRWYFFPFDFIHPPTAAQMIVVIPEEANYIQMLI
jgi:hypothetical protein